MAYTIFVTYQFEGTPYAEFQGYGHSTPIHCNYIETIVAESIASSTINLLFDADEFPFLANPEEITSGETGYGWTAWRLNALIQIVNATGDTVSPDPAAWKILDVTEQTEGWVSGQSLNSSGITSTLYAVTIPDYNAAPTYDLTYLNYPTNLETDRLAWGEEAFFFGNVKADIRATAYTTDIPIVMPLNQFNSTTNPTWDGVSSVYVSEVGIYDSNGNLVAIGKLNNPIKKDSTVARTIVFAMDF